MGSELNPPDDGLQYVVDKFIDDLPNRLNVLSSSMEFIAQSPSAKFEDLQRNLEELKYQTHKLVGTGGSLGFDQIANIAKVLHLYIANLLIKKPKTLKAEEIAHIQGLISEINKAVITCQDRNSLLDHRDII